MLYFAKWKVVLILGICVLGCLLALPNLLTREEAEALPSWMPHRQLSLGLDLQGGSHLLLEVDTAAVVRERIEGVVDSARAELRKARIRYTGLGVTGSGTTMVVTIEDTDRRAEAEKLLAGLDPDTEVTIDGDGRVAVMLTEKGLRNRQAAAVEQSIEIIRRRVDETGVREPSIQRQGTNRILVQLPGVDDPERLKALIGKTAKMTFHLVDDEGTAAIAAGGQPPAGSLVLPLAEERGASGGGEQQIAIQRRVLVSGENLVDSAPTFQQGRPVVSFRFDSAGGRRFGDATSENVGRSLAIVLDGVVISAPRIREPILGGSGVITGSFTVAQAQDLALLLRAGALPAPLIVLEERTVGPGLGSDSIDAGTVASVIALVVVFVFMLVAYGTFGVIADIALVVNLVLLVAALSVLQATLTLPGIAGIALTIGMAVDANVLIFEHVREEIRSGRSPVNALDNGFTRALLTILDSNLTTLFAALFLYLFGSGPVRGFSVTLGLGIITSMFTAVTVTRLIVATWLRRTRPRSLAI